MDINTIVIYVLLSIIIIVLIYLGFTNISNNSKQNELLGNFQSIKDKLENDLKQVRDKIKETETSLGKTLDNKMSYVDSEISKKQEAINKKQDEALLAQLKAVEKDITNNLNSLKQTNEATTKATGDLTTSLNNLQNTNKDEHAKFQSALNSNNEAHTKFQNDIAAATKSTGELTANLTNLQNVNASDHQNFTKNNEVAQAQINKFLSSIDTINRTLEERKIQMDKIQSLLSSGAVAQAQASINPELKAINELIITINNAIDKNDNNKINENRGKLQNQILELLKSKHSAIFEKIRNIPNTQEHNNGMVKMKKIEDFYQKLTDNINRNIKININEFDFLYNDSTDLTPGSSVQVQAQDPYKELIVKYKNEMSGIEQKLDNIIVQIFKGRNWWDIPGIIKPFIEQYNALMNEKDNWFKKNNVSKYNPEDFAFTEYAMGRINYDEQFRRLNGNFSENLIRIGLMQLNCLPFNKEEGGNVGCGSGGGKCLLPIFDSDYVKNSANPKSFVLVNPQNPDQECMLSPVVYNSKSNSRYRISSIIFMPFIREGGDVMCFKRTLPNGYLNNGKLEGLMWRNC